MKRSAHGSGFTLAEVLVAVSVISLMLVSLLQFVSFAGDVWQRNQLNIGLTAEAGVVLDLLEREMGGAVALSAPAIGASGSSVSFTKLIKDNCSPSCTAQATFTVGKNGRTAAIAYDGSIAAGWSAGSGDGHQKLNTDRYAFPFARHVETLVFTRNNSNQLHIELVVNATRDTDGLDKEVRMSKTVLLPQL